MAGIIVVNGQRMNCGLLIHRAAAYTLFHVIHVTTYVHVVQLLSLRHTVNVQLFTNRSQY